MSTLGRNSPCYCGALKEDGKPKKYKYCCIDKKQPTVQKKITIKRSDFISGPYRDCPSSSCLSKEAFGVFMTISGSTSYTRECLVCGHEEVFKLPEVKKSIIYLDQFVISNLLKLLDSSHKSHIAIKADPFWEKLFIKLEAGVKSQAIVCVDSFYHRNESLVGNLNFELMRRLYEHFSGGKTLLPTPLIQQQQLTVHFEGWLTEQLVVFDLGPQSICHEDLNTWTIGLGVSVGGKPYKGELDSLKARNQLTQEQIKDIWSNWQKEKNVTFINRARHEVTGLFKGLSGASLAYTEKQQELIRKASSGEPYEITIDDIYPPFSDDLFNTLVGIARHSGISEENIATIIARYFADIDSLLQVPQVKISTVMYAGLARSAVLGKIDPPKSLNDIDFISSYLPYCDAMFVDIESESLIKSLPKDTPKKLRLDEYKPKVFSLRTKGDFLTYLDDVIKAIPQGQIDALKDVNGEDYDKPYWNIIENEKKDIERKSTDE